MTVRVGLVRKPGILGWGSLDPEQPGIWVRPRRLEHFTIAHELTHLLQARGLVPRGERACDLWALARTPLVIDSAPGYLKLPRALRKRNLSSEEAALLCDTARRAIESRIAGDRRYLRRFEEELGGVPAPRPRAPAARGWSRRSARRAGEAEGPVAAVAAWVERMRRLVTGGRA